MKNRYWLIIIILLAAFLRLWHLGTNPPHLTPDEAALGYNAYSVLKTGRDEYGTLLPIVFKSFGDYKPGLYIYTAIPSIAILGLNEFSTRLPSAIAGIIAVCLLYLIVLRLTKSDKTALVSAFLLAILPWHIIFSRGAWEVNLSLTLTLAGIYFFLRSLEKQSLLIVSAMFFALTLLAYQGAKLSTAIVVFLLLIIFAKELFKFKIRYLIGSCLAGCILVLPIFFSFSTGQTGRLNVFSVFSYPRPEKYLQDFLDEGSEHVGDVTYYLFHPEILNFKRGVMGRYFNHFSPRFLFFEGDWANPRHSAPNAGMLIHLDIVLLGVGLIAILRNKLTRSHMFIIGWLVLSPLPAVLSRDQIHAVRAFNMLIPLVIITASGLTFMTDFKLRIAKLGLVIFLIAYVINYTYFLDAYFVHLPKHNSNLWSYGYKQMVEKVTLVQNNYKQIKVQQSYAQPYIYFLFYGGAENSPYDPKKYQAQARLKESVVGDVGQVEYLDNICFCAIDWSRDRGGVDTLVVADPSVVPPQDSQQSDKLDVIGEVKYLNGKDTAFRLIGIKQ